ncbi:MAG: hypothetical protein NTW47_22645 [Proteobacteria bacterium]|nr:hypothetical protein [Pseudomonadota bacterium]
MNKSILWVMLCAGFGALAIAQFAIAQSTYPSRAVRLVVPFPPGGGTDAISRIVGQRLGESLAQQARRTHDWHDHQRAFGKSSALQ